jgi:hypothetical protein
VSDVGSWPDGIDEPDERRVRRINRASPIGLAILSVVVALALLGLAGREEDRVASADGVTLTWHAPEIIRNGEFFEMRIGVDATRDIGPLVIGVDAELWEDFTINTMIPAAAEERVEDGEFLFDFGRLAAGTPLLFKVDAQINPDRLGPTGGTVTVYEGSQPLVELPLEIMVLP